LLFIYASILRVNTFLWVFLGKKGFYMGFSLFLGKKGFDLRKRGFYGK